MPTESIIALIAVMGMFVFFSAVLGWASHNAPRTFPEVTQRRSETGPEASHGLAAGAH